MLTAQGFYGGGFPITGSHEAGGVVSQVGEGVDNVQVGDRVIALNQVYQCGEPIFRPLRAGRLHLSELNIQASAGIAGRRTRRKPSNVRERCLLMFL